MTPGSWSHVALNGHLVPIVGVTPAPFFGVEVGNRYDVAVPLCADRMLAEEAKAVFRFATPGGCR